MTRKTPISIGLRASGGKGLGEKEGRMYERRWLLGDFYRAVKTQRQETANASAHVCCKWWGLEGSLIL